MNDKAHDFVTEDLYQNLNKFFANFEHIYLQIYRKYIGSHSRFKICGKFIVTYNIHELCNYHLVYAKSDTFSISFEELCEKDAIKKYHNTYCQSFSGKNIDLIFTEKMPLYNYLKIFINTGMELIAWGRHKGRFCSVAGYNLFLKKQVEHDILDI